MSFPAPEQLPALTAALIRLRGDTLGRIAEATGIRAANLSVWLRVSVYLSALLPDGQR